MRTAGSTEADVEAPRRTVAGPGLAAAVCVDGFLLVALAAGIGVVRFGGQTWPTYPLWYSLTGYAAAAAIHVAVLYLAGLYEPEPRLGRRPVWPRIVGATLGAVAIDVAIAFLTRRYLMPTLNLAIFTAVAPVLLVAARTARRAAARRRDGPPRLLLVGDDADCALAERHLADEAITVAGACGSGELIPRTSALAATDVMLVSPGGLDAVYPDALPALEAAGVGVFVRVTARDTLLGLSALREVGGLPCVALSTHALPRSRAHAKRLFDLLSVLVATPVLVPVLLILAAYVRAVAGPGALLAQERVGRDGRIFALRKFRTMRRDAEDGGAVLAAADDPRVVRGCRWLRATRLDELPQVWNVLRGEMSLVGPRPERPEVVARLVRSVPGYARRHDVPPGITGLAQVAGRYGTAAEVKLGYDLQYLGSWSPALDLAILARTARVMLARRG